MTLASRICAALSLILLLPALAFAVPTQLNHQGRLLDSSGIPVQGQLPVTFTLEDAPEDGDVVWGETLAVDFSDGYFSVRLGSDADNPIDAGLLSVEPLWLGITVDGGDQLKPLHPVVSAPYAVLSDSAVNVRGGLVEASEVVVAGATVIDTEGNWVGGGEFAAIDHGHGVSGVPLGTVIDWWRPSPDIEIPAGYQVCDGSTIEDVESPWFGSAVPDLIGRVTLGVTEEEVGSEGGSDEHSHEVGSPPHEHGIDHEHGSVIGLTANEGPVVTGSSNSPTTGSAGAATTSGADNTTVTSSAAGTTGTSNTTATGLGGLVTTASTSSTTTSTLPASTTGYPTNSMSGSASGTTLASNTAQTSSSGTGFTGAPTVLSTGVGSGSTGAASNTNTSSAGSHNHKTFRWDLSLRRWKHYTSSGSEDVVMDFLSNEGNVITTVSEDMAALGVRITVGDKTSYTNIEGSHSHVNSHTHAAGSHGHSLGHEHSGPSHSHQSGHDHDLAGHDHTLVHQHLMAAHDHDSTHSHLGGAHDHPLAHDHATADHNHDLAHAHTAPAHDHDVSHDHDISPHAHDAGALLTQAHSGNSGSATGSATELTSGGSNLPPYVGLLKLMRIR